MGSTGNVFAVVAYYVPGVDIVCEYFEWNMSSNTFASSSTSTLNSNGTLGTTLNIDGNDNMEFAVIWDDSNGQIYVSTGTPLSIYNSSPVAMNMGSYPDLCLYYEFATPISTDHIFMTYIDNFEGNGELVIDIDAFASVANGFANPIQIALESPPNSGVFSYPRIASPPPGIGLSDDCHVVVEEFDGSSYYIHGLNFANGTSAFFTYNDQNFFNQLDISFEPNEKPVVAYDAAGDIWVGWTFDNSTGGFSTVAAKYPIIVQCFSDGTPKNWDYWDVPTSGILATGVDISTLSIAGKYSSIYNLNLYSFYDANNQIVFSKAVDISFGSLRLSNNALNSSFNLFENIPHNKFCKLQIYDLTGRKMSNTTGEKNELIEFYREFYNENNGIYLLLMFSEDGSFSLIRKISILK